MRLPGQIPVSYQIGCSSCISVLCGCAEENRVSGPPHSTPSVFVYGTLTDRAQVERILGPADDDTTESSWTVAGSATLHGLHRVEGQYPTLAPGGSVDGRILAVDEAGLDRLDRYEGVDQGLYVRVAVPLADESGTVWTYVGDPDRLGVDADWPGEGALIDRVRTFLSSTDAVVEYND